MTESAPSKITLPNRQFDEEGRRSPGADGHSSCSDSEYQHALEVVFDPHNSHRRKSSLVASEAPAYGGHKFTKSTECYVHQLLEAQRRGALGTLSTKGLGGITEVASEVDLPSIAVSGHIETGDAAADYNGRKEVSIEEASTETRTNGDDHAVHSRLLTKKELSDMAWGVRELSKRLGSLRLKLKVKTVFLLTKAHDETLIANTRELARWLLSPERHVKYIVYIEETLKENHKFGAQGLLGELEKEYTENGEVSAEWKNRRRLRYWTNEMCRARPHTFDFIITLGGDGTVLYASWLFQRIVPPVLSFALGSLGFLTKFDYNDFDDTLTKAFRDGVTISLRLRFEGTVMRSQKQKRRTIGSSNTAQSYEEDGNESRDLIEELVGEEQGDERTHRPDKSFEILNDIVVDRGPNPTMASVEIFGDDEHFTSVQADGVCVATPTGSTAYNLAAGGSLCHPENPVILVTAICAHTLSFRPIILPDTIVLRLGVPYDARGSCWASFDGRERLELHPGDYVTISASQYPFANVMQGGRRSEDWVNSISGKLGWNTRQRQKGFKDWQ